MSRATVLFVITTLEVGGAEKQLVELATHLDRSRFEPIVCSLAPGAVLETELREHGVRTEALALHDQRRAFRAARFWGAAALFSECLRLLRVIRRERPIIVHGILFESYILGTFAAWIAGVPVIVTTRRGLASSRGMRAPYRLMAWATNALTAVVIANSHAVRQDTLRRERLPAHKVVVIHNGLDAERYNVVPDASQRRTLGLTNRKPVVGMVANFIHYKGHRYFFEAWREVLLAFPTAAALLIGDGPLRQESEALAHEMGLGDSVRFLGTRHDVPALLALIDLLVHPSLEEGFSNAILEGMAAGKPVVATDVGGNAEAVADGETGVLVPPGDGQALAEAMLSLLRSPATAARMGAAGRHRVIRSFSLPAMVQKYEALYERLISAPSA